MLAIIDSLKFASPKLVFVHETSEAARSSKVRDEIQRDQVLLHPILVCALTDGTFMTLDGTHRMQALLDLGCVRLPVQVVSPENLQLETWDHLVPESTWLPKLRAFAKQQAKDGGQVVATFVTSDGESFSIYQETEDGHVFSRLSTWHAVTDAYTHEQAVQRVQSGLVLRPQEGRVLVKFPRFSLSELMEVVQQRRQIPPGISRFIVQGRMLNLAVPIDYLTREDPCEDELGMLMQQRLQKIRFYSESVYLFE